VSSGKFCEQTWPPFSQKQIAKDYLLFADSELEDECNDKTSDSSSEF
jgi:hypothetical protein